MDVSSLRITDTNDGCRIHLHVRAGARRDAIVGTHADALKIAVTAPPERGKANRAVLELLAQALDLPPGRLRLLSGETSPNKAVLVEGLNGGAVRQLLSARGSRSVSRPARPGRRSSSGRPS